MVSSSVINQGRVNILEGTFLPTSFLRQYRSLPPHLIHTFAAILYDPYKHYLKGNVSVLLLGNMIIKNVCPVTEKFK
jgi:hypothetical protein